MSVPSNSSLGSINAFIDRLPIELLTVLFLLADHTYSNPEYLTIVRLSQVCKRWRSVIHSSACLWTHLVLPASNWRYYFSGSRFKNIQHDSKALRTYIERSRGKPLRLHVIPRPKPMTGVQYQGGRRGLKTFFLLLEQFVLRCHVFEVSTVKNCLYDANEPGGNRSVWDILLGVLNKSESLEQFSLLDSGFYTTRVATSIFYKIQTLSLFGPQPFTYWTREWQQEIGREKVHCFPNIKHLSVARVTSGQVLFQLLDQLPGLLTLYLVCYNTTDHQLPDGGPAQLLNLQELHLGANPQGWVWSSITHHGLYQPLRLLDVLVAPNLLNLEIELDTVKGLTSLTEFISFLHDTPRLVRLVLTLSSGQFLVTILQFRCLFMYLIDSAVPILQILSETELCITSPRNQNSEDEATLDIHVHPTICPNLRSVIFTVTKSVPTAQMARFIAARASLSKEKCNSMENSNSSNCEPGNNLCKPRWKFCAVFNIKSRHKDRSKEYSENPDISQARASGLYLEVNDVGVFNNFFYQ